MADDELHAADISSISDQILDVAPEDSVLASDELEIPSLLGVDFLSVGSVVLPVDSDGLIEASETGLLVGLPTETDTADAEVSAECLVVYASEHSEGSDVAVAVTEEKVAVHTLIPDANASKEYTYPIEGGLPSLRADGGVDVTQMGLTIDEQGQEQFISMVTLTVAPPWAVDANGHPVPTHYEVRENSIVQVVDFDESTAFPVTADPTFWQVAECVGAVMWVIGSTVFSVAKILKIKKLISKAGGVKKAMTQLMEAHEKWKKKGRKGNFLKSKEVEAVGGTLMGLASEILGITTVKNACFK